VSHLPSKSAQVGHFLYTESQNNFWTLSDIVIFFQDHQCLRIKILGDCYYCVAGVPKPGTGIFVNVKTMLYVVVSYNLVSKLLSTQIDFPDPRHANNCVKMGLDMINLITEVNVLQYIFMYSKTRIECENMYH
jgi:hypothetical protein